MISQFLPLQLSKESILEGSLVFIEFTHSSTPTSISLLTSFPILSQKSSGISISFTVGYFPPKLQGGIQQCLRIGSRDTFQNIKSWVMERRPISIYFHLSSFMLSFRASILKSISRYFTWISGFLPVHISQVLQVWG